MSRPSIPSRRERAAYCDLVTELGPDAPTLCEGWTTRDLTAHLLIRERRPDAAAGIVIKPISGYTRRVQNSAGEQSFERIVSQVRQPPVWSLGGFDVLDKAVNTNEFFVHHEDVRRAQPEWEPRPLAGDLGAALWPRVRAMAKLAMRKTQATVEVDAGGYGRVTTGRGGESLVITGDPGELAMFFAGRQRAARVTVTGPEALVASVQRRRFGV